jgi:hypothetical protein
MALPDNNARGDNDDRTVHVGTVPLTPPAPAGEAPAPAATTADRNDHDDNTLAAGTRLGEFEIIGLVGIGGFGIVYLAEDHSLGRRVALKEYMPSSLAARGQGLQVTVKSQRHVDTFEAGRRSFVNEARLLAQFDHPALVKVYRFWEANGTAYMVMPYYEGLTLKRTLQQMKAPPDEAWLRRLLAPLLDALEVLHAAQVYHRDIAPDNILLLSGERPLLLDFGAARHVISDMTQALTVILKPGYAPIEQYAEMPELKQGAWTDIYALAAVVHLAIVGRTPPPAVGRAVSDTMQPLAQQLAGRYSEAFLRAIDRGLAVQPRDRPQSVAEFRALLGLDHASAMTAPASAAGGSPLRTSGRAGKAGQPSRRPLLMAGIVAALALAAGGYWMIQRPATQTVAPAAETPAAAPASATERTPPAAPDTTAVAPPPTMAAAPFNALDEIDRIFRQRDREHSVTVALEKAQVRIGRDRLNFRVSSSRPGYLYVLMVGTDRQHFYKLFPNAVDTRNRIAAGQSIALPRSGWVMVAGGPPGANQFVAVVSANPRDFAATGLVAVDPFAEFPLESAATLVAANPQTQSPFLGKPVCPVGARACSDAYGAATFTIEETD